AIEVDVGGRGRSGEGPDTPSGREIQTQERLGTRDGDHPVSGSDDVRDDAVPDDALPAQGAGREIDGPDVTGRVVLNPTIGADDQLPVRDQRVAVKAGRASVILDVEGPPGPSVATINRVHAS